MRLAEMSQALIEGRNKRGLGMYVSRIDPGGVTQMFTNTGKIIAEITDRQPDGGYRLTVYPHNSIWWRNRVTSVLKEASRKPEDTSTNRYWHKNMRYSAISVWGSSYLYDSKTCSMLGWKHPMAFTVDSDHNLVFDYDVLENSWRKDEEKIAPKANRVQAEIANISPDTKTAINEILTITNNL